MTTVRRFHCRSCDHGWDEPYGTGRPTGCPACGGRDIHRTDADRGTRRTGGGGRGRRYDE